MAEEGSKLDRELVELLNELRVTLPGVQVLFAFLLILPFSQGFGRIETIHRTTYFIAFLFTTLASILLIAPTPYHRLRFRARDKDQLLRTSNRLTIAGTACLAAAMTAVVFLISDFLYGAPTSIVVAVASGLGFTVVWYAIPLVRAAERGR